MLLQNNINAFDRFHTQRHDTDTMEHNSYYTSRTMQIDWRALVNYLLGKSGRPSKLTSCRCRVVECQNGHWVIRFILVETSMLSMWIGVSDYHQQKEEN